jgi:hypothetical protein
MVYFLAPIAVEIIFGKVFNFAKDIGTESGKMDC